MDSTEASEAAEPRTARVVPPSESLGSNALRLAWSFGFNKDLVGGVHSLTTDSRRAIFYTAAHTGVIYDYAQRTQRLLQGHCHPISCCAVSEDKRWIVTADRGGESMIVVWDATTGNPIKTIFQPHPHGVQAIDISPDALFLVTLSAVGAGNEVDVASSSDKKKPRFRQELSVWEWTSPTSGTALHSSFVATEDIQYAVRFNTYDIRELISNGRQRVIFWNWAAHKLLFYSPSLSQKDFRQVIGNFTQSLFVPDSKQALTATEDGDLVLWDVVDSDDQSDATVADVGHRFPDRKAVKIVRLAGGMEHTKKVSIQYLTDMDGYLVLGSSDGAVRFYDFDFRLVAWFEDLNAGPVLSISFAATTTSDAFPSHPHAAKANQGSRRSHGVGSTVTDDEEFFQVPEFVVGTSSAFIVGLHAALFAEHESEKRRGTLLMQGINDEIHGLATHPRYAQVVISSYSGVLQLWDYSAKRLLMIRKYDADKCRPQCLTFSPEGTRLFVGFTSGLIKILHAQRFEDLATLRLSKVAITDIRVSLDASLFVAIDANFFLGMWRAKSPATHAVASPPASSPTAAAPDETANDDDTVANTDWTYLGRCRAHSKPITGLEFFQTSDGTPLLVSISEDKTLAEYCLSRSSIVDGIVLTQSPLRIEQGATPTACCWHPEMKSLQEDMLIIANDEYKLKQWNANNKICRKTTLGPSYGGPMNRLVPVPLRGSASSGMAASERYCVYSTHEKVVGLLKLPLDGNPHKSMGLIAHPSEISNVDVSFDGNYLMTAGGKDLVMNLWEIHTNELDMVEASAGSDDLEPYFSLLEGGKDGAFYQEIVDYFYFAQLRVQGENATSVREITARIPLQEIPNVMRALGFYLTEQEIQHMWSEVKYSQFTQTTQAVESIDLREFIKLYINHRPVFAIGKHDIERAFKALGVGAQGSLKWDTLQKRLLHMGEQMTEDELRSCLDALLIGEDSSTIDGSDGAIRMDSHYTALSFADKVLGFDDYQALEQDDNDAVSGT